MNRLFIFNIDRVISFLRLGSKHFLPDFKLMEQHESMGKGIPADVTDAHKMFRFARSKPDWCTELGKAFTMAG